MLLFKKAKVYKYIETTMLFVSFYALIVSLWLFVFRNAIFLKKNIHNNKVSHTLRSLALWPEKQRESVGVKISHTPGRRIIQRFLCMFALSNKNGYDDKRRILQRSRSQTAQYCSRN
jgi:hypothetical protein